MIFLIVIFFLKGGGGPKSRFFDQFSNDQFIDHLKLLFKKFRKLKNCCIKISITMIVETRRSTPKNLSKFKKKVINQEANIDFLTINFSKPIW